MIIVSSEDTNQRVYGNGSDGNVTVTGTVDIKDLYENDSVTGVTTYRGVGKGLNHGAGSYDPHANETTNTADSVPNCVNFTVAEGAVLTCSSKGTGTDDNTGVVWIAATGLVTIAGQILGSALGYSGGARASAQLEDGNDGYGPGAGKKGTGIYKGASGAGYAATGGTGSYGDAIAGGLSYGASGIPTTTWAAIFGSGGGSGVRGTDPSNANPGGAGGAAIRIYGVRVTITGTITSNGANGASGNSSGITNGGWSGGGSGGSIFIQCATNAQVGTNLLSAAGGTSGGADQLKGGAGSVGRIHIEGAYTGSTLTPPIA